MSQRLINHSPDLRRLVEEGYSIDVVAGYLVVRDVPYVDALRKVRRGMLVSTLDLAGDRTVPPKDHQAWFKGSIPCDPEGQPLEGMVHADFERDLGCGIRVNHFLCSKPMGREFTDYYEKVRVFVLQISSPAIAIDPTATARIGHVASTVIAESPFNYTDTAVARNNIGLLAGRVTGQSVAIIGLGGTGSYVLDLVAKTPVTRIHLFDGDDFLQHNAFRAPGASSCEELARQQTKVSHFDRLYSKLHKGIIPHGFRMSSSHLSLLDELDFIFVCIDDSSYKRPLVEHLELRGRSFIDVGMGLYQTEHGLAGTVRVTTSTPAMRSHVWDRQRIPMSADNLRDPYATNIQVAELNALNAALAVIRWKRIFGFYADFGGEHFAAYSVDGNHMINEDSTRDACGSASQSRK